MAILTIDKDESGNHLYADELGNFWLRLTGEDRKRGLGRAHKKSRTLELKNRQRDKHLLKSAQAYGFNYKLIHHLHTDKGYLTIFLSDEYDAWQIPMKWLLDEAEFLYFKKSGFEKQIFAKLNKIDKFSIMDKRRFDRKSY